MGLRSILPNCSLVPSPLIIFFALFLLYFSFCAHSVLAEDVGFSWPIDCVPGVSCVGQHFRIGYPDIKSTGKSFSCDKPGYKGHQGTDIVVSSVEQNVRVFAAADGIVRWTEDGLHDHCPDAGDNDCNEERKTLLPLSDKIKAPLGFNAGNYIVIEHNFDGIHYLTLYAHLRNGSLRTSAGKRVSRGEGIANAGSSGNSQIPHLHFGIYQEEGNLYQPVDPWKGPCNSSSDGLWSFEPPYGQNPTENIDKQRHRPDSSEIASAELLEAAKHEEKQKNLTRAIELYDEIARKFPDSPAAIDANKRLLELQQNKP